MASLRCSLKCVLPPKLRGPFGVPVRNRIHTTVFVVLLRAICALAQSAPVSPDRPWHTSAEFNLQDVETIQESRFQIDSSRAYSLADLIDLAETHNPATRASWERARAQAANLGISRS